MINLVKPYVFLALFVFISSCDLLDESPCGPKTLKEFYLIGSSIVQKDQFNSYMEGNNRVFQWSQLVENVCTDEHVQTTFRIAVTDATDVPKYQLKARARVSYQFLYENSTNLNLVDADFKGELNTGLKGAFPDLHGWFTHTVEIYFPSKGSYDADFNYLFPKNPEGGFSGPLISVEVTSKFREFH